MEIDGSQLFKQGNGNAAHVFARGMQGLGPIPTEFLFKRVAEVAIQNIQIYAFDTQFGTLDSESMLNNLTIGHNTTIAVCETSEKIQMPKILQFSGAIVRQMATSPQIDYSKVLVLNFMRVEESKEEVLNHILSRCKLLKRLHMTAYKIPLNLLSALSGASLRTLDSLHICL